MIGQTLIDGSDMGNIMFLVQDEFTYNNCSINESKCGVYYIKKNKLKETIFNKCYPEMVHILRGKGNTLFDKILYIYKKINILESFKTFYANILHYGMLKYILSRLLYGNFNLGYLSRSSNDKFLEDLESSRFCNFIESFLDCNSPIYGYNKYFK